MAKFDPYNWWKRGVRMTTPLRKAPRGASEPLVWHQIQNGDFRPSPYWDMSIKEIDHWKKEIEDYKGKNPRISEESVRDFADSRWRMYRKRIEKLKESHLQYETSRLSLLKEGLIKAFGVDIWDEMTEKCDGDETKLYKNYKTEAIKRKGGSK
jgi:hypothetical protein